MFSSVLVANRGEIARRVIRTLQRLGVEAVAVYVPADRRSPHTREADRALPVSSYLDIEDVVSAAGRAHAEALHPGYGFLSENPDLARACAAAGVTFVGPPPEASELMGDKQRAKELAVRSGVPVLPTFELEEAQNGAVPYPLVIKAAAGGGGRGMRVIEGPEELEPALASARREAQAGFGSERVFIERFLPRARHIEVQVLADAHGHVLHLGERECSLQRRHQKLIEETPSPAVDSGLRRRLGEEAVALARAGGYVSAGTVEFIADFDDPGQHYFLEMNARLQVEHPVTEMVTGLDLVELQLRVAAGEPLELEQAQVSLTGHAIEARINAEDPTRDFLPASGRVLSYHRAPGARVDDGIETGTEIGTGFDSLLAKVIVHRPDRASALAELDRALARTTVLGVQTTTGFLRSLLATQEVREGRLDTRLIERLPRPSGPSRERVAEAAARISLELLRERPDGDPFSRVDGWRLSGRRGSSWWRLSVAGDEAAEVRLETEPAAERVGPGAFALTQAGMRRVWSYAEDGEVLWLGCEGWTWPVLHRDAEEAGEAASDGDLRAPMPGQVLLVPASVGERVEAGDTLVVLESMKMELAMTAPLAGRVAELSVGVGDRVVVDQPLARVESTG